MVPRLSLFEDIDKDAAIATMPAGIRMVFVVHGAVTIDAREFRTGAVWFGEEAMTCTGGAEGATVWRWELSRGEPKSFDAPELSTRTKLSATLDTIPEGELLFRGDSVAFLAGGTALATATSPLRAHREGHSCRTLPRWSHSGRGEAG